MTSVSQFAYTQARLQAWHGLRPTEQTWSRLAATGDLASYLQIARHTSLQEWIITIHPASTSHDIELILRQLFLSHIDNVARWQPTSWHAAVLWCKQLTLLPVLRHLLAGEPIPDWLRQDHELKHFTSENQEQRVQALQTSLFSPIIEAWQKNKDPTDAWLAHWRHLWPKTTPSQQRALDRLSNFYLRHLQSLTTSEMPAKDSLTDLQLPLQNAFRHFSFQPAAAFVHLGLMALDIQQLRGDLLQRCLFTVSSREQT